jgi:hypothetical protein
MMMRRLIPLFAILLTAHALAAEPPTQPTTQPTKSAALEPVLITMHLKDVHPKAVFAELGNQVNANFRPSPAGLWEGKQWPTVSIDLDNASFFDALKEISDKTGLYIQRGTVERNFFIVPEVGVGRLWTSYPISQSGQFLFSLHALDRAHRTDFVTGQTTRQVNVRLMLYTEPKLRVLKISPQTVMREAVDELGNKLVPIAGPVTSVTSTWAWSLNGRLTLPVNAGSRIERLTGAARLIVQTQSAIAEIPDVLHATDVERVVAGHRLVVKKVGARGETYTVSMTITRDPAKAGGWGDINLSSTFRLVDANGMPLSRRNYGGGTNMADYTELNLMFGRDDWNGEGAGPPAKLIWEVPTATQEIEVPFSFEDVPLPW